MPIAEGPLTEDEIRSLRRLLLYEDRNRWFARNLRAAIGIGAGVAGVIWGLLEWLRTHLTFKF